MSSATVNRTQLLISANRLEPDTNEATECPKFVVPYMAATRQGINRAMRTGSEK